MNTINKKFKNLSLVPKYLYFDPVSIEITKDSIRIIKLNKSKYGLIPDFYKEIEFKKEIDLSGLDSSKQDFEFLIKTLKKLKTELKFKYVALILPEEENYIYKTEFPAEVLSDLSSAIKLNIEENVPLSSKEVNFSYKINEVDDHKIESIVSVFPKSVIKVYSNILEKAGLIPVHFQNESESIVEAVIEDGQEKPLLLVKMSKNQVNIAIVENNIVNFASKISINCCNMDTTIKSEELKSLSQELNKTLIYWFTNKRSYGDHKKIENAVLVGEMSQIEGLVEYLEDSLKIDVELGNVWTNCFSLNDYIPEISLKGSLEYAAVIGLSLIMYK